MFEPTELHILGERKVLECLSHIHRISMFMAQYAVTLRNSYPEFLVKCCSDISVRLYVASLISFYADQNGMEIFEYWNISVVTPFPAMAERSGFSREAPATYPEIVRLRIYLSAGRSWHFSQGTTPQNGYLLPDTSAKYLSRLHLNVVSN